MKIVAWIGRLLGPVRYHVEPDGTLDGNGRAFRATLAEAWRSRQARWRGAVVVVPRGVYDAGVTPLPENVEIVGER